MSSVWTIRRSATDIKVSGLCAGIAEHWGVDPVVVRVGAALLALSGGIGVVLYLAGWLLVPRTGRHDPPIYDVLGEHARSWPRELWMAIIAVACILTATAFGTLKGVAPALILALIWYFGYYKSRVSRPGAASTNSLPPAPPEPAGYASAPQFVSYSGPPSPFTEAADAWRLRVEQTYAASAGPTYRGIYDPAPPEDRREPIGPAATLPPARPLGAEAIAYQTYLDQPDPAGLYGSPSSGSVRIPTKRVSRAGSPSARRLRLASVLVVGLTLAGLGIADAAGVRVPALVYLAATLLVLGLTLVVAAWVGRARGILAVALLVLVATLGAAVNAAAAGHQGWGTEDRTYTAAAQLTAGDHHQLGRLRVDLSGLERGTDQSYTAQIDMGLLEVVAPASMNLVVNWQLRAGALQVDGQDVAGGTDLRGEKPIGARDPRKKTLKLNLSAHQGLIRVVRR